MSSNDKSVTQFLNVDLDIRVQGGLETLLDAMGSSVVVLNQAAQTASVELNAYDLSLEEAAARLAELVNSLSPEARTIWGQCELRSLNIGILAGVEPHSSEFAISKETVSAIADAGLEVVVTVYAPRN
ncbi:hypothetical protein CQ14_25605 [Bradyrhizobium lablabi]|uniref:Uncharacterized protein n=1 Tax=Bradyrhizobium lablabi TaxID=722472 RepID=A0A0R3N4G7_9BRAD|nr:hypothetical protein [Bradyrhizobium lablabi]KRR25055.1 hypothetical protein CQ14_25605 [Bradyrhizobium lablabi]